MTVLFSTTGNLPPHLTALGLTVAEAATQPEYAEGVYLLYDGTALFLCKHGEKGRVCVDFVEGAAQYRRTKGGGELIAKAVKHTAKPMVWDATGGLGRDAFVLAGLGLNVCVFEQNTSVAGLLADGLQRARMHEETAQIAARLRLFHGDSVRLMADLPAEGIAAPDVVYLDPMYPERQKSAAVKKEMAYFHNLVGAAQDEAALLAAAKKTAKKRVVVKRPRLGVWLNGERPAYVYEGKSTRFDVYLPDNPR